jgi:aminopeptidase
MDPRIREHAEVIADHSVDLSVGDRGANPITLSGNDRYKRAYLRASDEDFETPGHEQALIEESDVYIAIRANRNVTETSDVAPETNAAYSQAHQPILDERLSKRWCLTQYPAPANAQLAEESSEGYENFVWDAILKDWDAVREHQAQMVELLDPADEVRIVSGETTDVRMSVDGNPTLNDYGEKNLPGGEVFTAPIPDSVEGDVLFDKPLYHQGREVTGVSLTFEDGDVVDHSAEKNEAVLTEVLNTDEGARRLGELGIGMNRDIDRFTYNMLFDEKMGDTVHMAVGRAYGDTVGEDNEQNQSAVHVDMIVDMAEDSFIEVDGEVVQRDGTFRFEAGFEE